MITNLYSGEIENVRAHEGKDLIQLTRALDLEGQNSQLIFVDYAVIPPGASIGIHDHKEIEEVYIILEGEGELTLGDDCPRVARGDVIFFSRPIPNTG